MIQKKKKPLINFNGKSFYLVMCSLYEQEKLVVEISEKATCHESTL
jgi:c-di-GMP-related signal transduction protein